METIVLILLSLINGDVYSKAIQMPEHSSHKDCLNAGAQWLAVQDAKDSPQYVCLVKSDVSQMEGGGPPGK